jgi:hypothetical protein
MINVCFQCGSYRADKQIDPQGPFAICPECGFRHPFLQLPLLVVSGASASGKTSVCRSLLGRLNRAVLLDSDILWQPAFNTPENHYREFFEIWLRMCKNINQSGSPVVLFGAGMGVPDNIEPCIERRYFSSVEYLALVCDDEELGYRLLERPVWRGTHAPEFIAENQRFNGWFKAYEDARYPIRLIDTTVNNEEETVQQVEQWILEKIHQS